ncbi:hypothetical protein [Streptomyces agglomeratus]|nr:hypothetical protein [Streptomyces agglomeratus]
MSSNDRTPIATAAIGSGLVCVVAYSHPVLIGPLTLGFGAWLVLYAFMKL